MNCRLVVEVEDIIGVNVQLELVHFLYFDCFYRRKDVSNVVAFVRRQDKVYLFVNEPVEEDIVPPIGAGLDEVKVVDHEHKVGVGVFVEGLQGKDVADFRVLQYVSLKIRLIFLLHLFAVDDVNSVFEHASLDKHPANLL